MADELACDHAWLQLPWYRVCLVCFSFDEGFPGIDREDISWEEFSQNLGITNRRPWTTLTTRSKIFMQMMRDLRCPKCGGQVVEESTTREDGTIATGFTCTQCPGRWWVNDEAKD